MSSPSTPASVSWRWKRWTCCRWLEYGVWSEWSQMTQMLPDLSDTHFWNHSCYMLLLLWSHGHTCCEWGACEKGSRWLQASQLLSMLALRGRANIISFNSTISAHEAPGSAPFGSTGGIPKHTSDCLSNGLHTFFQCICFITTVVCNWNEASLRGQFRPLWSLISSDRNAAGGRTLCKHFKNSDILSRFHHGWRAALSSVHVTRAVVGLKHFGF